MRLGKAGGGRAPADPAAPWPGTVRPEPGADTDAESATFRPDDRWPGHGQTAAYDQQSAYDQPAAYDQQAAYDQPAAPYGQPSAYGQQAPYGGQQQAAYGQPPAAGPSGEQPPPGAAQGGRPGAAAPGRPPRRRRRRVLAIVLVVLVVLFVVGDRIGVAVAKDQMRKQVVASIGENLKPGDPVPTVTDVSIGGFPFLTQVLFGKYKDIGVGIEGIATPGPKISSVKAHLKGLHVPFGDAISDNVGEVPVDSVKATVGITYADLNAYLARQPGKMTVTPVDGGKRVEVSGIADIPGFGAQQVGGVITFGVTNNMLTLAPSSIRLKGALNFTIPLPGGSLLPSLPIPVSGLPFSLRVVQASTNANGLSLTATAKDVVLPPA
ncbi:conserved hypothetical protein [Frankia canadensis]|uniref:DUF2993 domain-containing protein n=1 Tax=Frankia canadensis TaxID=1836972 RepID=A0A2I2KV49_9ACTN|nr:DUF2993 domain-containing protein [Frankia canadensis]SNQ49553.1 conserved hypothetical protein [Frankia canadensis]SOU56843.1 conserved hypothetical protein [Frankia canadensis]